jgi:hypothetical protein
MAMKAVGKKEDERSGARVAAEPLAERRAGTAGSFYLHVSDPSHAWILFMQAEKVLSELGYSCSHGSLQTDPHPKLGFIDSFEVFLKTDRRHPELFGTVTLYGTIKGGKPLPRTMKFDPVYPNDAASLVRAVGMAIETAIPQFSAENPERDIAIAITEGPEHAFTK